MLHQLRATFFLVTPAFLAGGDQSADASLRVASFKGVLRFWWRALALGQFNGDLHAVAAAEADLFGSTKGQAKVLISLKPPERPIPVIKANSLLTQNGSSNGAVVGVGARYLGYGLMGAFGANAGVLTRGCLFPSPNQSAAQTFELILTAKPSTKSASGRQISQENWHLLQRAVIAMGLFGGVGARARKGWGSLALKSLVESGPNGDHQLWTLPKDGPELEARLKDFWRESVRPVTGLPVFTAFSDRSDAYVIKSGNQALPLLDSIGSGQQAYRSWGSKPPGASAHQTAGHPAEQQFKEDHDWAYSLPSKQGFHPRRVVFGLPHNYGKGKRNAGAQDHSRRASPLFLHIQALANGEYAAVATILPAVWLPAGKGITGGQAVVPANPDYAVIRTWIEGTKFRLGTDTGETRFPHQRRIIENGRIKG